MKEKFRRNSGQKLLYGSAHIFNQSPTFSVRDITPQEAWSERKSVVDHFRIFGCIAYAHVPDERRKKLEDRSLKCVFLGVNETSKDIQTL